MRLNTSKSQLELMLRCDRSYRLATEFVQNFNMALVSFVCIYQSYAIPLSPPFISFALCIRTPYKWTCICERCMILRRYDCMCCYFELNSLWEWKHTAFHARFSIRNFFVSRHKMQCDVNNTAVDIFFDSYEKRTSQQNRQRSIESIAWTLVMIFLHLN